MTTRIITGLLAMGSWLLLLYINSFFLIWLVLTVAAAIALHEYSAMALRQEGKVFQTLFLFSGLLPVLASCSGQIEYVAAGLIVGFIIMTGLLIGTYSARKNPFDALLKSCFGIFYAGFLPAHLILIMTFEKGTALLLFLTIITVASDTGAYFIGKSLGRHKLCPAVSPKKTIEGFGGGLVAGVAGGTAVAAFLLTDISLYRLSLVALVLTCLGVLGDLTESVIKRTMNVKDSGTILPGHGGILDRIDSLLMTAPVFFYTLHSGII